MVNVSNGWGLHREHRPPQWPQDERSAEGVRGPMGESGAGDRTEGFTLDLTRS